MAGRRQSLKVEQITALSSAAALTPHAAATICIIQAESQNIRWRDDGTNPTSSVGMLLTAGTDMTFIGDMAAFRAIEVTASAKLNVAYYS